MEDTTFNLLPRLILEDSRNIVQFPYIRDLFQYKIDSLFTAPKTPTNQLKTEVDAYYHNQPWYSKIALRLGIKKTPPRIRAFEHELSTRVAT